MGEECHDQVLSLGYGKVMLDLGICVRGSSFPSDCTLLCSNICFAGSAWLEIDINQTMLVTCDDDLSTYWKVTYIEYMSEYAVRVRVCKITTDEEPPEPTPPPVGEVDYDRIESDTAAIVDDAESRINSEVSEVTGAVSGVAADISNMHTGLTGQVTGLTAHVSGLIDDLSEGLGNRIDGMSNALTSGLAALGEKIDGLQFPTLDSIKQGFLDTCADLAIALWDAILDRIEERYPDDEEEEN